MYLLEMGLCYETLHIGVSIGKENVCKNDIFRHGYKMFFLKQRKYICTKVAVFHGFESPRLVIPSKD